MITDLYRLLRRHRKHFRKLPPLILARGGLWEDTWGLCIPGDLYFIFVSSTAPDEQVEAILLHELCHAEAMFLHEDYAHDKDWTRIARRVHRTTGIAIE